MRKRSIVTSILVALLISAAAISFADARPVMDVGLSSGYFGTGPISGYAQYQSGVDQYGQAVWSPVPAGTISLYACMVGGTNTSWSQCEGAPYSKKHPAPGKWVLQGSNQCTESACTTPAATPSPSGVGWKVIYKGAKGYPSGTYLADISW